MKTFNYRLYTALFCALFVLVQRTYAAWPYPTSGAPIFGVPAGVTCGQLKNPDKTIWWKVSGSMVATPHDKIFGKTTAGASVDVNFNVPKPGVGTFNRYSLVSYTVDEATGKRTIYDYQSNEYFTNKPSTGSSNQQLVLLPTCKYELYWVRGCIEETFTLPVNAAITGTKGPAGNPYNPANIEPNATTPNSNRILGYDKGGSGTCETCPVVVGTTDCVNFRLLEVIKDPVNGENELIFSVINNVNTINNNCGDFPFVGDVLFANINPTHTKNNTPYSFRYNYQLGPKITGYQNKGTAFVFDQRNNHDLVGYDLYQSEIFRFKVTDLELQRLALVPPADPNQPEVCAELSSKHPEPHQTIPPLYCARIDFSDCADCPDPVDDVCFKQDCCFSYTLQVDATGGTEPDEAAVGFTIENICGGEVSEVNFTLPGGVDVSRLDPFASSNQDEYIPNTATPNLLRFIADNTNSDVWDDANTTETFIYDLPRATILAPGNNLVTVTVISSTGISTQIFDLTNPTCGITTLAVELTDFTGKAIGEGIALEWRTSSEKDNDHFDIERSLNGRTFEKIGEVEGNGTVNSMHEYNFLDKKAGSGVNYYRLRQVDFDGSTHLSKVVAVNTEGGPGKLMTIYPNPSADAAFKVKMHSAAQVATLEIRDITGKLVHSRDVKNAQEITIDGKSLGMKQGVYMIRLKADDLISIERLIVK